MSIRNLLAWSSHRRRYDMLTACRYRLTGKQFCKGRADCCVEQAIDESGGWEDRSTAEDVDLTLGAGLLSWEDRSTAEDVGSLKKSRRNTNWNCKTRR
uniref:Uncharacterized protein n=1 Tax=Oryza barthii TaxID=65489 RepID=A0A0D3GVP4_9ORYZ